jgi:hypothetical protein
LIRFAQGLFVAFAKRQFSECFIGGFFLIQDFFQKVGGLCIPQKPGPFIQSAVGCHFIMFHLLPGRDQRGVDGR